MKQWIEPDIVDVPEELRQVVGGHPLIAETLCRRGIVNPLHARGFLNPADYTPTLPFDLPDIERAVERIEYAIRQQQKICVWGDFDVDGQTATSLLVSALKMRGARNVSYYIPDRQTEGHGVHLPKLKQIIAEGIHLIITCDSHRPSQFAA
jgi:single-stranded-DNA-specific exonuclease